MTMMDMMGSVVLVWCREEEVVTNSYFQLLTCDLHSLLP
jgi:hypothetical protein